MSKTEVVPVSKIEYALREANITEQVLAGLRTHMSIKVTSPDDRENYAIAHKARMQCKELRVLATKIAKAGRESAIAEQKAWITEEKRITGQISEVEAYLESQEWVVEEAEARAKEEAQRKAEFEKTERERLAREKFETRANALMKVGVFKSVQEIATMLDSDFDSLLKDSTETFNAEIIRRKKDDEDREVKRKELELQEKIQRQEREKLDAEKRKIEMEKAKAEALAEGKRIAEERAEQIRRDAEEKARREADEKIRKEAEAKAEAERLEALKPDKEKLLIFAGQISAIQVPVLKTEEAQKQLSRAVSLVDEAVDVLYE